MADIFSKQKRSAVMAAIKSKHSKIENKIADLLKECGVRYRAQSKTLPGKPDFYFTKIKTVLFVDSCFWHGCRYHGTQPKTNSKFWMKKITRNKKRDREINQVYRNLGWKVIRVWEHNLKGLADERILKTIRSLNKMRKVANCP